MHEMSLCEGILQLMEGESKKQGFNKVKTVVLQIGSLAMVDESALRFSFDIVTKNSIAEESKLVIEQVKAQAWCMPCGDRVQINKRYDSCPKCQSHQLQVTEGDEMKVKELGVE